MPAWIWSEQVLTDVARALREWHEATSDFSVADAQWGLPPNGPREVICHNDFAPYNCVFSEGRFVGAIDFDACSPGSRIWDLAYTAYRFVPLLPGPDMGNAIPGDQSPFGAPQMSARLELFLSSYQSGDDDARFGCSELIRTAIDRLHAIAAWTEEFARGKGNAKLADHAVMYRGHARWLGSLAPLKTFLLILAFMVGQAFSMSPPSFSIYCDSCGSFSGSRRYLNTSEGRFGKMGPVLDSSSMRLRLRNPSLDYILVYSEDGKFKSKSKEESLIRDENGMVKRNVEKVDFVYHERFTENEKEMISVNAVCGAMIMGGIEIYLGPWNKRHPRPYDFMKPVYGAVAMFGLTTALTIGKERDRVYFKYAFR
jgi:hypothetical protein